MREKTAIRDMTKGNILVQLILFSLPLIIGNVFQVLYNTVDTYVVGNYVGKEALAAVGSTGMIINMVVFFFNGLSIGGTDAFLYGYTGRCNAGGVGLSEDLYGRNIRSHDL